MSNFNNLYHSFKEFYETFFRGNEVEFVYKNKKFYLLPAYSDSKISGICFGTSENTDEQFCNSLDDLYNLKIEDDILGNIIDHIDIIGHNI